jgi:endonuclease G
VHVSNSSCCARLATLAHAFGLNAATETTLVGFGNNDTASTKGFGIKREVDVEFVALRRSPQDNLSPEEAKLGFDSGLEFVAGGEGHDSCNGDSGGPAYIRVGTRTVVAGITSRATDVATSQCGDGGIYTHIDSQVDFIRHVASTYQIEGLN